MYVKRCFERICKLWCVRYTMLVDLVLCLFCRGGSALYIDHLYTLNSPNSILITL